RSTAAPTWAKRSSSTSRPSSTATGRPPASSSRCCKARLCRGESVAAQQGPDHGVEALPPSGGGAKPVGVVGEKPGLDEVAHAALVDGFSYRFQRHALGEAQSHHEPFLGRLAG